MPCRCPKEINPSDLELAWGQFCLALVERPVRFVLVLATRFLMAIQAEFGEND